MNGTQDSNEIREVAAGTEFHVELRAPGGTGYHWHMLRAVPGIDFVREEPRGTDSLASGTTPTPGSPVVQRFALRADREATVVFGLKRSWERAPVRTHTVTVRLAEGPTSGPEAD